MPPDQQQILDIMEAAALAAGTAILDIYRQQFTPRCKADGTPVTLADETAEKIILNHLAPLNIPVLAEECVANGIIPKLGNRFFVVDPLDGTKEFVKKNGEFTVNIALIENSRPVCGIITMPGLNKGYLGSAKGAFCFDIKEGKSGKKATISVAGAGPIKMVVSRSHADPRLRVLREKLGNPTCKNVGSSLKLCMLATGQANLYPRFSPTCEWDMAAGEAILEAAGGIVLSTEHTPLEYGKISHNFRHPPLVAAANPRLALDICNIMSEIG